MSEPMTDAHLKELELIASEALTPLPSREDLHKACVEIRHLQKENEWLHKQLALVYEDIDLMMLVGTKPSH